MQDGIKRGKKIIKVLPPVAHLVFPFTIIYVARATHSDLEKGYVDRKCCIWVISQDIINPYRTFHQRFY